MNARPEEEERPVRRDPGRRPPRIGRLVGREDLSPTLAIFRIEPEGGVPPFVPGQFVPIGIELDSGQTLWRPYSIASPPEQERILELYIRLATGEPEEAHLTHWLFGLSIGARVLWKRPRGRFAIADEHPDGSPDERGLLLVAGGTGLAPFISYALHRERRGFTRSVIVCHGARNVAELGYRDVMLGLEQGGPSFRYLPSISRPHENEGVVWSGHTGRVETLLTRAAGGGPSALESAIGEELDPRTTCTYVCGFDGTVSAVLGALEPLGFRSRANPRADGSYDVRSESYG